VQPNAEKRTNVEVLIGHPMLKAEAAEKLSCWPKITSAAKSHERKQSTYRSAEVLRHLKAVFDGVFP
jgi:hypothetical protein